MTTSAFVIVINKENRILLQHRSSDAPTNPSKWQLWGGAIEEGENSKEAAIRELNEELKLNIPNESLELLEILKQDEKNEAAIYVVYFKNNIEISLGEGDGYGFFDAGALDSLDIEETTKTSVTSYFNKSQSLSDKTTNLKT